MYEEEDDVSEQITVESDIDCSEDEDKDFL
jgi:hypothetical protein